MNLPPSTKTAPLYANIKVAVLTATSSANIFGGAERFYMGLVESFREIGCQAELISMPADEHTFDHILENYKYCANLDLSTYDVVISTNRQSFMPCHVPGSYCSGIRRYVP